jgi:Xaa-Pro aminopeptidase
VNHAARRSRIKAALEAIGADVVLVTRLSNVRYLTGFSGSLAALFLGERDELLVDARYEHQASAEVDGVEVSVVDSSSKVWPGVLDRVRGRMVAIEGSVLTVSQHGELQGVARTHVTDGLVERARQIKDADEIEALRRAVHLTDVALEDLVGRIALGQTEYEVAGHIEMCQYAAGGEISASPIIACSGPRTALAHGAPSARALAQGEPVMVDVGTTVAGYRADTTRTFHLGEPSDAFRSVYNIVLEAQSAALDAVAPGRTGREIDDVARSVIARAGYAEAFGHSLGHSLGLDYHEKPLFGPFDDTVIEPGMVMTVEPGIYLRERFGVRIEDQIVVTESGADNLTHFPKELIEL